MKICKILTFLLTVFFTHLNAQLSDHTDYPLFMKKFWKNDNLHTQMMANQMLATKSGEKLIRQYEKADKAIQDWNDRVNTNRSYAEEQQELYDDAVVKLTRMIKNETLWNENEETQVLAKSYKSALELTTRKLEINVKNNENFDFSGENLVSKDISVYLKFLKDNKLKRMECKNGIIDNCKLYPGYWYVRGSRLYLTEPDCTDCDEEYFVMWFVDDNFYMMDRELMYTYKFSNEHPNFIDIEPLGIKLELPKVELSIPESD